MNAGTRQDGGMIVRSISLGKVNHNADAEKIMSVVDALAPVLDAPLFRVERREVTSISS